MSVHYKFKSSLDFDTVTFDGLHISVSDLKKSILQQKKIGKAADFDLQITNAQTKEVYTADDVLIPKNTSVIISRVPVTSTGRKNWERNRDGDHSQQDVNSPGRNYEKLSKTADLVNAKATEEDKIKAMMTQSSQEYDPSKYVKSRSMTGPLPPNYTCFRCGKSGHWIKNCPTNNIEVKRSTGIPRSFMVTVDGPDHKGALLTSTGEFAVPLIDHEAYKEVKKEKPPFMKEPTPEPSQEPQLPDELLCMICRDLLQDAVLIPCCGNSFCDECVRQALLDSEQHECPVCHECDISPNNLIPNRFLRTAVLNFKNETGYTRVRRLNLASSSAAAGSSSPSVAGTSESSAIATSTEASTSSAVAGSTLSVSRPTSRSASPVVAAASPTPPAIEEKGEAKDHAEKSPAAPVEDVATQVSKEPESAVSAEPAKEDGGRSPVESLPDNPPGTPLADERPEDQSAVSLDEALTMSPQHRERSEDDDDDGRHRSSSTSRRHRSPSSRILDNGESVCAIATITTRVPNYAGMPVNLPGRPGRDSGLDSPRGPVSGRGPGLHRSSRHGDYGDHRRSRHDYGAGNSLRAADYRGAPLYPSYGQAMAAGAFHAPPPMHMPPGPPPQGHLPPPNLPPPPFPGQAPPPGMTAVPLGPPHYPMTTGASYINPAKPFGAEDYHARRSRSRRAGDPLEEFEKHLRDLHRNRRSGRDGARRRSHSKTRSRSSSYSRSRSKSRPRSGGSRSYSPRSYSRSPRSPSRYSASSRSYSRSRSRSYTRSRSRSRSGAHVRRASRSRSQSAGAAPRRASSKSPRPRRSRSGSYRSSRSPGRGSQQRRGRHYPGKSRRPYPRSRSPRSPRSYHHHPLPPQPVAGGGPHGYRGGRSPPPPPPPPHFRGHRRGQGHFFGGYPPGGFPPDHMGMPVEFDDRHYYHHHHDVGAPGFRFQGFQGGMPPPHHEMRDRRYDPGLAMARFHGERPPRSSRADYPPPDVVSTAEAEALKAREGRAREYSYRRSDAITTPLVVKEGEGKERKGGAANVDVDAKALKKKIKEKEHEEKLKHKHHHKAKEMKKEVGEGVPKKLKAKTEAAVSPAEMVPVEVVPTEGTTVKVEKEVATVLAPEVVAKEKKHKHKKKLKLLEEAAALRKATRTSDDSTSQLPPGTEEELLKRKKKKKKLKDGKLQEKGLIQQMMEVAQSQAALQAAKAAKQLAKQQLLATTKQEEAVGARDAEESSVAPEAQKTLQVKDKSPKLEEGSLEGTEMNRASTEIGAEDIPPAKPELQVELPELSKWEREDLEEEGELSPAPKPPVEEAKETKPALSSEVLMRAEKVLLHKPLKTAIVAASSVRLTGEKKVKSTLPVEVSASAPARSSEPSHATPESTHGGREVEPAQDDKPPLDVVPLTVREVKEGRREVSVASRIRDRLDGTLQVTITSDKERRSVLTAAEKEQRNLAEGQLKRIKLDRSKFGDRVLRGDCEATQGSSDSSKPPRSSSRREDRDRKLDERRGDDRRSEDHRLDDRRLPPEMVAHEGRPHVLREERSHRERGSSSRSSQRLREGSLRSGGRDSRRVGPEHRSRTPEGDRGRRRKEDHYYGMPPEERLRRSYEEGRREMMAEADRRQLLAAEEHRRFLLDELERQQRSHHDHRRSRMDPSLRFRLEEREMEERRFAAATRRMDWPPPPSPSMAAPQSQHQSKGDKADRSHHHHHHQQERVASFAVPSAASVPTQQKTERFATIEARGRKESTQDESRFEPDYDELIEDEDSMQRNKRKSVSAPVESEAVVPVKKPKMDVVQEAVNPAAPSLSTVEEVTAAAAEDKTSSSSSDSSDDGDKHKKHKKKHKKHKKHKHKHKKKKKSKKVEKSD